MDRICRSVLRICLEIVLAILRTISISGSGCCRFNPTCSQYAREAIKTQPIIRALINIIVRTMKCHPFSHGGYDPVT